MAEAINIYFSIQDDATSVLKAIGNQTKALDKETQELEQTYEVWSKSTQTAREQQIKLQNELKEQKKKVQEAKSAFDDLGDAVSKNHYEEAVKQQAELQQQLDATTASIKANERSYKDAVETIRKSGIQGNGKSGSEEVGLTDFAKGLLATGAGNQLSSSLSGIASSVLTSAIGVPEASMVSETLGNALSGAMSGVALGLPGILAGGAIGAVSGLLSGATQIFEAKDEAFKSYYQDAYNTVTEEQSSMLSSGSAIAGSREQTQMAFAQRLGSDEAAREYLDRVKAMAANTNYDYDDITGYSKKLLNSYDPEEVFRVLQSLSDATAGLDLSGSDVDQLISGLSRMRTTGKATSEYLNYFRERGIDADQALADALGVDKSGISDLVSKGKIGGTEAAEAILDYIDREFGGLSDKLASTYDAMVDNLADAEANLQARMGEGYNETRKEGIQAQMDWMSDSEGELGDAYSMIGAWQASLENTKEQLEREALDAVMSGVLSESYLDSDQRDRLEELAQAYQDALAEYEAGNEAAGAQMGALLAEAQVIAMNEYNASDGARLALESELALAGAIRDDAASNEAYYDAGYRKSQEFSRGLAAGLAESTGEKGIQSGLMTALENGTGYSLYGYYVDADTLRGKKSHAFGLDRVPYDEYPALLHEGERVLTASEARSVDRETAGGATYQVTVTGNSFMGTGDEMAGQVAEVIVRELERASIAAVPR